MDKIFNKQNEAQTMESIKISTYLYTGTALRFLQDRQEGDPIHQKSWVIENINNFLRDLKLLNLKVTLRASVELKNLLIEFKKENIDAKLSKRRAEELRTIMSNIRHTFFAEAQGINTFIVSERNYNTDKLLCNMQSLFGSVIFNSLPDIAQYDFNEAGKCIAYQRSTAAAFHLLRGIEASLLLYHNNFFRGKNLGKTWGNLTHALKNKTRGKLPDSITVNHLDNIRHSFRNPTQHPEKTYDIQEVENLLGLTLDVINRMIKGLDK